MWSGANLPSILGEMVVALTNTSGCTYESAPVAVMMEQYMINQMLDLVGFSQGEGQMTTGSSNANMIAMMIARNKAVEAKTEGLFAQKPLYAFVNSDAHYSFDKAANILGIGTNQLIKVPNNAQGQMDVEQLEQQIQAVIAQGGQPFFIGATLGTTVRGAYDSVADILPIAKKYQLWLHGDGAWGGAVIVHDALKEKYISGIEQLDSFTMDFHKMLGSNLMCNFLLVNQPELLCQTCATGDTSYIFHDPLDLGVQSLQCGRRVDSLKWFLDWKFYQKSGFAKRIEHYHNIVDYTEDKIKAHPKLSLVAPRASFNLCFNHIAPEGVSVNDFNQKLRQELQDNTGQLISIAYVNGVFVFRLLITHAYVDEPMIDQLLADILTTAEEISK